MSNPRGRLSEGWIVPGLGRPMGEPSEGLGCPRGGSSERLVVRRLGRLRMGRPRGEPRPVPEPSP